MFSWLQVRRPYVPVAPATPLCARVTWAQAQAARRRSSRVRESQALANTLFDHYIGKALQADCAPTCQLGAKHLFLQAARFCDSNLVMSWQCCGASHNRHPPPPNVLLLPLLKAEAQPVLVLLQLKVTACSLLSSLSVRTWQPCV